ncbi:MAG TPA: alpha/beta hydrolase [Kofleriaceae bacterium]|nr:alpha/beta hydrolase [Kofleriaceae bacterium]
MALFTLARWLGPWADSTKAPTVETRDEVVAGIKTRFYGRGRKRVVIAPGLHYAAADDSRMDRFCRIVAASGSEVIAPFIPDYLKLTPGNQAKRDFTAVFDEIAKTGDKPIVFSISFGSLLAFALAAERGEQIERLIIFGGYSDFHAVMRFCLTGEVASGRKATRDPLNQPVVLMNLLHILEHDRSQTPALVEGWMTYVRRVWGRAHFKVDRAFVPVAEEIAPSVPESVRELYRVGIGVVPGAVEIAMPALEKFDATALDPMPYLACVKNRVDLVHGMDDDVIPFEQSHELAARLVNADVRVHITGLYGHTGTQRLPIGAMAKELVTMVRVLRVLSAS